MAITKSTVFESFLIRGDGKGGMQAAHVEYLELINDGDEVLSAKILPAQPLTLMPKDLAPVIGAALAAALESNSAQATELAAATTAKAEAEAARDQALNESASLTQRVADLTEQIAALTGAPPANAVSRKQIKVALNDAGLLDQFEATVSDPQNSDGKRAWISWQENQSFTKDSPVMAIVLGRMKLTDKQIDALFVAAAKL